MSSAIVPLVVDGKNRHRTWWLKLIRHVNGVAPGTRPGQGVTAADVAPRYFPEFWAPAAITLGHGLEALGA
jgi:hypothetical protein